MALLKTIEQSVYLPAAPKTLYDLYLNAKSHAAFTGAPVELVAIAGGRFSAFGGQLVGTILTLIPDYQIVQRWRSSDWKKSDADSILSITLHPERKGCRVHLVHINVPGHDFAGVTKGWEKYYWGPLREFLKRG